MIILGIESSCDETSAAIFSDGVMRSNIIATQAIHEQFGGVVPELASRAHQQKIWGTVNQAVQEAGIALEEIDTIAVTNGPGLMGALLVGLSFAKGLALRLNKPIVGVNHMDAHIYANFIDDPKPEFPFLSLTVSGGHTQLVLIKDYFDHELLGQTRDDAAGEAFDKIGKMLGLPYPAGPVIDRLAKDGDPDAFLFPQSLLEGYEFSYSGLKTAVLYRLQAVSEVEREQFIKENLNDLCASVSHAITEPLIKKVKKAVREFKLKTVVLAGGVSANNMLRTKMEALAKKERFDFIAPKMAYCTDNAAMIAVTGALKAERGLVDDLSLKPFASL
ncbi:tRNA (adenosine(37)-N6)-threonylcarbamoyltransferase complex transferase subunit TsaD [bacterium]|nr:MAG: tRNA (adenosine(37)-N6)-threonylcarbamoyltransferase complex transferase subunit TsaD [bacterium]